MGPAHLGIAFAAKPLAPKVPLLVLLIGGIFIHIAWRKKGSHQASDAASEPRPGG